ncbi:DUF6252 family protein [Nonlabens marinus]|uniref:Uncharacterized protein n=1 Tax=Nonlabens marinus S1-08 TaxID=1454201 RepID=W8VW91_9FLAO|nr:DUF6252 family protein [Nonlabens marinus]BAO54547.1 hypothetical protein NMS_0538 [Nonlabens marinus S1-08]
MNKLLLLIVLLSIAFTGCEENIDKINSPALQASRNGEFFGATKTSVTNNTDGTITIGGENPLETLQIRLTSATPGFYELGSGQANEAIYTFNGEQQFSTRTGNGAGSVILDAGSPDGTVTGNFSFVSYTPGATDTLTMRKGVIYRVPFGTEVGSDRVNDLKALINGTALNPSSVSATKGPGTIVIQAANGNNTLLLSFPEAVTVGSYNFSATGMYRATYSSGGTNADAISGTLDVSIVNRAAGRYSGLFKFESGPPGNVVVTQGSFTITL